MISRPFCKIYGTRYISGNDGQTMDSGGEYTFYSEGRFFSDIIIPLGTTRDLLYLHGNRDHYFDLNDLPAYVCFPMQSGNDRLLCYARANFHSYPGRETQYRQVLIFDRTEIEEKNCFIQDVLGFRFRTEAEIMSMAERKVPEKEVFITEKKESIDFPGLSERRRTFLCTIMKALMSGDKITIRFPAETPSEKRGIQAEINLFLLQLFSLIPAKDRCGISFSTARTEYDFSVLDEISMLIVDSSIDVRGQDRRVFDLDSHCSDDGIEELIMFSNESDTDRSEAEIAFSGNPREDLLTIKALYDPEAWWWNETKPNPDRFFTSLAAVKNYMDSYPSFGMEHVRKRFCARLPELMNYEGGIVEAVLDALFFEKGKKQVQMKYYKDIRKQMMGFGIEEDVTEQCRLYRDALDALKRMENVTSEMRQISERNAGC